MTIPTSTRTSRLIRAPREKVFRAFLEPKALEQWLSPEGMTGKIHEFQEGVGGGYRMSLYYPESEQVYRGKSAEREDRFTTRFVEIAPPARIVQSVNFETDDPSFAGEMTMIVTLDETPEGTEVTIAFENIPSGVRPEDNDTGTRSSLEKLARYVESGYT